MDWTWYLSFKGRINQSGCTITTEAAGGFVPFFVAPGFTQDLPD